MKYLSVCIWPESKDKAVSIESTKETLLSLADARLLIDKVKSESDITPLDTFIIPIYVSIISFDTVGKDLAVPVTLDSDYSIPEELDMKVVSELIKDIGIVIKSLSTGVFTYGVKTNKRNMHITERCNTVHINSIINLVTKLFTPCSSYVSGNYKDRIKTEELLNEIKTDVFDKYLSICKEHFGFTLKDLLCKILNIECFDDDIKIVIEK